MRLLISRPLTSAAFIVLLLVAAVLVWFLPVWVLPAGAQAIETGEPAEPAASAQPEQPGELVTALPATRQVQLTGYTRARRTMDLVSEMAGRCQEVYGDVGDTVAKNGVFVKLDTTFIDLALKKNRAARAELERDVAYYSQEAKRYRDLVTSQSAAQSVLDQWEQRLDGASLDIATLDVAAEELTEQRNRYVIHAPAGWKILAREVEPGEWVSVGESVGRAGDYRTLLVPFALTPEEHAALHAAKRLELVFPDFPGSGSGQAPGGGLLVDATIERDNPEFDPETRKLGVDLMVKDLPVMRGGLRAELSLTLSDPSGTVLVPLGALHRRYEESWLVRDDGSRVPVVYLGPASLDGPGSQSPAPGVRVRAPGLAPGQSFRLAPGQSTGQSMGSGGQAGSNSDQGA